MCARLWSIDQSLPSSALLIALEQYKDRRWGERSLLSSNYRYGLNNRTRHRHEQESFHLHIEKTPDADGQRLSPIESESGSENILSAPSSKKKVRMHCIITSFMIGLLFKCQFI